MSLSQNEAVEVALGELRKALAASDQFTKLASQVETLTGTVTKLTADKTELEERLQNIQALPQPAKGQLRVVDKSYDLGDGNG